MDCLAVIHYHGTPITPLTALYELAGKCFCVSFGRPEQIARVQEQSQSTMGDNGAWRYFNEDKKAGREPSERDWTPFYAWCERWLRPCDWAVIPDVIGGGSQLQDALVREWPLGKQMGAPVWHMDEPIDRLLRLTDEWPRVCIGSTEEFFVVLSDAWIGQMDKAWNEIAKRHRRLPWIHMLRGMQCSGKRWPFGSVDSTDVAQNHNRPQNTPRGMADRWDAIQCPWAWEMQPEQLELA